LSVEGNRKHCMCTWYAGTSAAVVLDKRPTAGTSSGRKVEVLVF